MEQEPLLLLLAVLIHRSEPQTPQLQRLLFQIGSQLIQYTRVNVRYRKGLKFSYMLEQVNQILIGYHVVYSGYLRL